MRHMVKANQKADFNIRGFFSCFQHQETNRFQRVVVPLLNRCCWRSLSSIFIIEFLLFALGTVPKGRRQTVSEPAAHTFYLEAARSSGLLLLRPPPPSPLGSSGVRVRSEDSKALHGIRISENGLKMTTSSACDLSQKIAKSRSCIKNKIRYERTLVPIHTLL